MKHTLKLAALAGLALLLTGCQTAKQRALCPAVSILATTSNLTKFKEGLQGDPSGVQFTIEMIAVKPSCDVDVDEGTTDSDIDITFRATRPPNGDQAHFTAPFYVAPLLDGKTILDKKMLATAFTFQPGETSITFKENVPSTLIKFANGVKPYQYSIVVGLQLTPEQLTYSKNHGRFGP
ncbi:MAG: hypothetical protein JSR60_10700 [Proteobacteria bacterium]|nr:hypothetical protein [Pseudomonadota bacterium]